MLNYPVGVPIGNNGQPLQGVPAAIPAKARKGSENNAASSVITLSQDTTAVEIAAVSTSAIMRWVTTGDTQASVIGAEGTSNYDHVIPVGTVRRFVVPIEAPTTTGSSMVGINRLYGLYRRVAVKSTGVGSILTSEF